MMKILIVDDSELFLRALERPLTSWGDYKVLVARNGLEAREMLDKDSPDLVILDIMMPKVDGFQVCSYVRNELADQKIKVLMISASVKKEDVDEAMRLGADDYLAKPFDNSLLKEKVKSLLSQDLIDNSNHPCASGDEE